MSYCAPGVTRTMTSGAAAGGGGTFSAWSGIVWSCAWLTLYREAREIAIADLASRFQTR